MIAVVSMNTALQRTRWRESTPADDDADERSEIARQRQRFTVTCHQA